MNLFEPSMKKIMIYVNYIINMSKKIIPITIISIGFLLFLTRNVQNVGAANESVTLIQTEETDNDWFLPADVERSPDSGFYQLGLLTPTDKIPIYCRGGIWNWEDFNPIEGEYRFDIIQDKLDELRNTPYSLCLRIKCSEVGTANNPVVPSWVITKYNLPTITLTGGKYDVQIIPSWHDGVEAEFTKFLDALGQTNIQNDPKLVFAQIHGISSSRGEELNLQSSHDYQVVEAEGFSAQEYKNWAIKRIDAWANAFNGVEYKLLWSGREDSLSWTRGDAYDQASSEITEYVINKGASFRGGIIELYFGPRFNKPESTGQRLVKDPYGSTSPYYETYIETDLDFPIITEQRMNGEENEEYWSGDGETGKWGDTLAQRRHRWLVSNLMSLTLGVNVSYSTTYAYNLNPTFSDYVQKSFGKTVETSRDAFAFLFEGYTGQRVDGAWRSAVKVKNIERYLYQRDLPGATTIAVEKFYRKNAGNDGLWGDNPKYDQVARRTDLANGNDRMYFDVEDRFIHRTPQSALLKITYKDNSNCQWYLQFSTDTGGEYNSDKVTCANDGKWKTATFNIENIPFLDQLSSYGQDFAIVAENEDVTVKYVRIIKQDEIGLVCFGADNIVNKDDVTAWAGSYIQNGSPFDTNSDSKINSFEFSYLLSHWGEGC
jgi:hypothetical protein